MSSIFSGVPTLLSAILALWLIETSGKDLPQNMNEGKDLEDPNHNVTNHKSDYDNKAFEK